MKFIKILALLLPLAFISLGFYLKSKQENDRLLLNLVYNSLKGGHYAPLEIDDKFSDKAFESYIKNLDPNKRIFLQSDIKKLNSQFKSKIDNEFFAGELTFFETTLNIFLKRLKYLEPVFDEIFQKGFDFEKEENLEFDVDKSQFPKNDKIQTDFWRKYLKYQTLSQFANKKENQEKAIQRKDTNFKIQSVDSLYAQSIRNVKKSNQQWFQRMTDLQRRDHLAIFINSLTNIFDPHTNYYPPKDKENFDINISGRLEGIGATLVQKDGYIQIVRVVPGGPAFKQSTLGAKDIILKVKQEGEEAVDISGWRIDDAIKIIRGKKGTTVTLTIKKPNESIEEMSIVRDVVVIEETYAKSLLLQDEDKTKVGYIYLPGFYTDFSKSGGRTCWKDVKKEIEKIDQDQAEALIIDLRNNGGGSLNDVVQMGGLFISKGPIVQVKYKTEKPYVMKDRDPQTHWEKPLVIMVNEFSASASEILAAAMQDYQRAVIVGSPHTHGKGTVQRFIDLNRMVRNGSHGDLGAVKLTTQKFYRINGESTQLKGVIPDIILPDFFSYLETGEKEYQYALEWDKIEAQEYQKFDLKIDLQDIIAKSKSRVNKDSTFIQTEQVAQTWKKDKENTNYSLQINRYINDMRKRKEQRKFQNNLYKKIEAFDLQSLSADWPTLAADSNKFSTFEKWRKELQKDHHLFESLQIAEDLINAKAITQN